VKKLKISRSKYSATKYADTLFLELPLGAGWSRSDPYMSTYARNDADLLTSLNFLAKKFPERVNKKRPIYFYISSYGSVDVTEGMLAMLNAGWNVKGAVGDGPIGNYSSWAHVFMENLWKYGAISWPRYQFFKWMGAAVGVLHRWQIIGNMGMGWLLQVFPILSLDMKLLASPNDVRPEHPYRHIRLIKKVKLLTGTENFRKALNGRGKFKLVNFKCMAYVFFNGPMKPEINWNSLLEKGVKLALIDGKYDYPFGGTIMHWLTRLPWSKENGFDKVGYEKSKYGRSSSMKNLFYEEVEGSGHTTAVDKPWVISGRMKEMIDGDILNAN
jgi:hypothetical protein